MLEIGTGYVLFLDNNLPRNHNRFSRIYGGKNKLVDLNYSPVIDTASLRTDNASWFGF